MILLFTCQNLLLTFCYPRLQGAVQSVLLQLQQVGWVIKPSNESGERHWPQILKWLMIKWLEVFVTVDKDWMVFPWCSQLEGTLRKKIFLFVLLLKSCYSPVCCYFETVWQRHFSPETFFFAHYFCILKFQNSLYNIFLLSDSVMKLCAW